MGVVNDALEARRGCKVQGIPVSLGPLEIEVAPSHQPPSLQVWPLSDSHLHAPKCIGDACISSGNHSIAAMRSAGRIASESMQLHSTCAQVVT